ncbi:MAG: Gfo/Idh/MocA family oxidoreductase, partial [Bacteroidota bacterium]
MKSTYNWGILATGKIAGKFAEGLATLPDANRLAIGSRKKEHAEAFATTYGFQRSYGSYEALVQDPDIDIIYVATPHPYHLENTLLAIAHGKHVLCEKPLAINAAQAQQMIDAAKDNGVFLMEALWSRFLPAWVQAKKWIKAGKIGTVRHFAADFSIHVADFDPLDRKFNLALGGSALLDIGIYPIAMAQFVMEQTPVETLSTAYLGSTGADFASSYLFRYPDGAIANLSCGFEGQGPLEAIITGTKGLIRIPLFWKTQRAIIELPFEEPQVFDLPYQATGLQHQAVHVMEMLRADK